MEEINAIRNAVNTDLIIVPPKKTVTKKFGIIESNGFKNIIHLVHTGDYKEAPQPIAMDEYYSGLCERMFIKWDSH